MVLNFAGMLVAKKAIVEGGMEWKALTAISF